MYKFFNAREYELCHVDDLLDLTESTCYEVSIQLDNVLDGASAEKTFWVYQLPESKEVVVISNRCPQCKEVMENEVIFIQRNKKKRRSIASFPTMSGSGAAPPRAMFRRQRSSSFSDAQPDPAFIFKLQEADKVAQAEAKQEAQKSSPDEKQVANSPENRTVAFESNVATVEKDEDKGTPFIMCHNCSNQKRVEREVEKELGRHMPHRSKSGLSDNRHVEHRGQVRIGAACYIDLSDHTAKSHYEAIVNKRTQWVSVRLFNKEDPITEESGEDEDEQEVKASPERQMQFDDLASSGRKNKILHKVLKKSYRDFMASSDSSDKKPGQTMKTKWSTHPAKAGQAVLDKPPLPKAQQSSSQANPNPTPQVGSGFELEDHEYHRWQEATFYEFDTQRDDWIVLWTKMIRIAKVPFARGGMRFCFKMEVCAGMDTSKVSGWVAKCFMDEKVHSKEYFSEALTQSVCDIYAQQFKEEPAIQIDKTVDDIVFLPVFVMKLSKQVNIDHPYGEIFNAEPYLHGLYKKYTDNKGNIFAHKLDPLPEAFCHYSYERLGRQGVITDLQGVGTFYTDPQIHCENSSGFGHGNCGLRGIKKWKDAHQCNAVCQLLELLPVDQKQDKKKLKAARETSKMYWTSAMINSLGHLCTIAKR